MQTIVAPGIERDKAISSAVEAGNRFFQNVRSHFRDEVSVAWQPPVTADDASLTLTLRYRPNVEVTATIPQSVFQDSGEFNARLDKLWQNLLMKITRYHNNRLVEKLAALDEDR